MRTGVQLRLAAGDGLPRSELLAGVPCEVVSGAMGPVALFRPGEIVAYLLRGRRRGRLFVFRTLDVDDRLATSVPGVRPRVQLLLELHTPGRIRRGRDLFAYLGRTGRDPSGLADPLYVRVSAALGGRLPAHTILLSLLRTERPSWTRESSTALKDESVASAEPAPRTHALARTAASTGKPR
jgi:hypothetical protein